MRRISTSLWGSGSRPSSLSKASVTSARLTARRAVVPWKMASSILEPRMADAFCSPSTQRIASLIFDLPQPFGPTIAVMPSWKRSSVRSANDLKPCRFSRRSFMNFEVKEVKTVPSFFNTNPLHQRVGQARAAQESAHDIGLSKSGIGAGVYTMPALTRLSRDLDHVGRDAQVIRFAHARPRARFAVVITQRKRERRMPQIR